MQAITTKYLGPTNSRDSRVLVKAQAGRMTVPWDHALGADENHRAAARAYAERMGWQGTWHGGALPDGSGNVYVCSDRDFGDAFTVGETERPTFEITAGRTFMRDGADIGSFHRNPKSPLSPSETDDLVHEMARLLIER